MKPLISWLQASPVRARVVPFAVFVVITVLGGELGEDVRYWGYLARTLLGAAFIWMIHPFVREMRWAWSWPALWVGVGVFVLWVGLDGWFTRIGAPESGWNPHTAFGDHSILAWAFIVMRIVGSSLVVPPLEEVFYRSFLYRYVIRSDFLAVSLGRFAPLSFCVTSVVFGFAHHDWLSGILCGAIYQGLVCWKGRLGDAMTAHAITNFLLGIWVVTRGDWHLW